MKRTIFSLTILCLLAFMSCQKDLYQPEALVPPTVMEDASLPSIEINGVRLHSMTFGDPSDPMLVVLHGGPGADFKSLLNFKDLADAGLYVVFYDQRGSGLSQRLDEDGFSAVQVYIDELEGVINHYRQVPSQKILLAGQSWGAMLATAYINQNPDEISGAILSEPGGLVWEQVESYIDRSMALNLFDESTNDLLYKDQVLIGNDHEMLDYKLGLSSAYATTGDTELLPFWRYGGVCNSASIKLAKENPEQMDFTQNLKIFNQKVLFAYSELNTAYGVDHANLVSSAFANVELVEIQNTGHEIPHFGWEVFKPIIINYLNEIM